VFSWTGFYVGANVGGAWARNSWTDTLFVTNFSNGNNSRFIGGGQIGGNYQIGSFANVYEVKAPVPTGLVTNGHRFDLID
jgi:hypothetical protein